MSRRRPRQLTYSNVVSTLCLFILLGGGAYAASTLPKNSVGPNQVKKDAIGESEIRKGAVRTSEVKDFSLLAKDFKAGQLPAGKPGPGGERGPAGADFSVNTTLAPGQSESGGYGAWSNGPEFLGGAWNFRIPLAAPLDASHVVFTGATSTTHCPGRGTAERGFLCVYEQTGDHGSPGSSVIYRSVGGGGADAFGWQLFFDTTGAAGHYSYGGWTVTAP
jgi:hypothetical protein